MFIVMVNVVRTEKRLKAMLLLVLVATWVLAIAAIANYKAGNFMKGEGQRIVGFIGGLFESKRLGTSLCDVPSHNRGARVGFA